MAGAGQSGPQPLQPNQPQNQPSWAAWLSRIITAAPLGGNRRSGGTSAQREAGDGYISLIIMAPSGTGRAGRPPSPAAGSRGRFCSSQRTISGEYQITTAPWVL